jgi:hypothetical protein
LRRHQLHADDVSVGDVLLAGCIGGVLAVGCAGELRALPARPLAIEGVDEAACEFRDSRGLVIALRPSVEKPWTLLGVALRSSVRRRAWVGGVALWMSLACCAVWGEWRDCVAYGWARGGSAGEW